jgi:hypothetical protein
MLLVIAQESVSFQASYSSYCKASMYLVFNEVHHESVGSRAAESGLGPR